MHRTSGKQAAFRDDHDRSEFLALLVEGCRRFAVEIHAYALMGNHYHLILHCPAREVGSAMHYLGTVYTQRFNRRHQREGPLFRGRFHSLPISDDVHFLEVSRYVHRNPLALELAGPLWSYPWSSYGTYLHHHRTPTWLHTRTLLWLFGNDAAEYQAYVEFDRAGDPALEVPAA
jgi:REP element-mobilizing transposase RayT